MARVSVIISTYNRRESLGRAIRSVLGQSMDDLELIVVDDCSTEPGVRELVAEYEKQDERVQYIRMDKNFGHDGGPKNVGIRLAASEYVAFLDDDDVYRRDALKVLTAYAKESKQDVVYGDYLIDGKPGWSLEFSVARLSQMNFIAMDVALIRRDALLKVGGFDENVPKFKDWNLWLRMQKSGATFMHVPIIVTEVSGSRPDSISQKFENEQNPDGTYNPTFFNPADCTIWPDKTSLGERKPLKVAVYTLTMNRLEYTKQMAKALEKTSGYPFDWYVIDQGSEDGTQEWIKGLTRDQKHTDSYRGKLAYKLYYKNVGLAKGWNNILEFIKSEGEYDVIVKVDNDAELMTDGWLKAMVEIFERNRRVILSPYVEGLEGSPGGVLRQRASGDSPYILINDKVLGIVPNLGGIVFATPIEAWDGWKFDEEAVGNKDLAFSKYAARRGYLLAYMEEFRVWHIDGTAGQHKKYPDYFSGRADVPNIDE